MRTLWFTWKDRTNPLAGGAELVNEELAKRLAQDGHEVLFVVGGYKGAITDEVHQDGYRIVRVGNRFTVYFQTYRYYKKNLQGWADVVIDEINTIPFFAKFYVKEPNLLFVHQLCRKIWFYEMPPPLSFVGYLIEPLYLRMLSDRQVVTVSKSTKFDLMRFGFGDEHITVISEGLEHEPLKSLTDSMRKFSAPTLLSLGSMRSMKRTLDQIRAFEIAKQELPKLRLVVAGDSSGKYGKKVLQAINDSTFSDDIVYKGRVSNKAKYELMQQCHLLLVTSVKEGWCLVVSEAASMGTPAVVYDVDGLRDSVVQDKTGIITSQDPEAMCLGIESAMGNKNNYVFLRENAWHASKRLTYDKSYSQFSKFLRSFI